MVKAAEWQSKQVPNPVTMGCIYTKKMQNYSSCETAFTLVLGENECCQVIFPPGQKLFRHKNRVNQENSELRPLDGAEDHSKLVFKGVLKAESSML